MDWFGWLIWGFAGTVILTTLMAGSQGLGLTRMNLPYLLGTLFTGSRDRARVIGIVAHMVNGFAFSLVYVGVFHAWGRATWWLGATAGFVHAAFMLAVLMPMLPSIHPRMASAEQGPTVTRQLEPPGFLALNYGVSTPISMLLAHVVFGAMLGLLYRVP